MDVYAQGGLIIGTAITTGAKTNITWSNYGTCVISPFIMDPNITINGDLLAAAPEDRLIEGAVGLGEINLDIRCTNDHVLLIGADRLGQECPRCGAPIAEFSIATVSFTNR